MAYNTSSPVLSQPVNPADSHRTQSGCAPRGGNVTPGQPYTMPNGTNPEIAREIYIGAGSGEIVLRQVENVDGQGNVVSGDVTFVASGGQKIHMLSTMVVSADASMTNLVWLA